MKIAFSSAAALLCASSAFAQPPANPPVLTEEIHITASPLLGDAIDQTQSVAEVSRETLMSSGGFGLGDVLKNVPGVTSSSFSPGAARPVIRGFDASRVRVTENGIGSHDASDISGDHGVPIDPLSAIEVEVLRGPGTLRYGSQAIGGVVNAINNRIPFDIAEGTSGEFFAGGATNATERMTGGVVDYRGAGFAFHADGVIRGSDDFDTPRGPQENTWANGEAFALGGAYVGDQGAGGGSFTHFASRYGIASEPGGEVSKINLKQDNYAGAARLNAPLPGIKNINGRIGYSDYSHDEIVAGEGILATFNNKEWEGRVEALHGGFGLLESGAIGAQWSDRDFEALGEGADFLLPTKTQSFAGYAFERFQLRQDLMLEGALRVESANVKGATNAGGAFDRDFMPTSIALGVVFSPIDSLSLSLNLSQTERAPNAVELFAQGPHEASGTFEIGSPTLGKERARSVEAGIHYDGANRAHASLGLFSSAFHGFVAGVLTGNSYDEEGNFVLGDAGDFAELHYIQRNADFSGFEAEAHVPLHPVGNGYFGVDLKTDYVRAKFGEGGGNVPRIPPFRFGGALFFEGERLRAEIGFLRTETQDDVAAGETPTDGCTMVDASATYRLIAQSKGGLDMTLAATNLTDAVGRNHVSFTKDYVLLPGRNVRLMLRYSY